MLIRKRIFRELTLIRNISILISTVSEPYQVYLQTLAAKLLAIEMRATKYVVCCIIAVVTFTRES